MEKEEGRECRMELIEGEKRQEGEVEEVEEMVEKEGEWMK